jgi:hypothetical protein
LTLFLLPGQLGSLTATMRVDTVGNSANITAKAAKATSTI